MYYVIEADITECYKQQKYSQIDDRLSTIESHDNSISTITALFI